MDEERPEFSKYVDFIVDLVPLQLWGGLTKDYLWSGILQP